MESHLYYCGRERVRSILLWEEGKEMGGGSKAAVPYCKREVGRKD